VIDVTAQYVPWSKNCTVYGLWSSIPYWESLQWGYKSLFDFLMTIPQYGYIIELLTLAHIQAQACPTIQPYIH
jgi:hypothetical protein